MNWINSITGLQRVADLRQLHLTTCYPIPNGCRLSAKAGAIKLRPHTETAGSLQEFVPRIH